MDHKPDVNFDEELLSKLRSLIEERLDVEAIAQKVEQLNYAGELSGKLNAAFGEVRSELARLANVIGSVQQEIRDLILDIALLKRATSSLGQLGVIERRRIERDLILDVLPPTVSRPGTGVQVYPSRIDSPQQIDCENRIPHCKAACCRIFNAHLTLEEVESDRYDWDPKQPYSLRRERQGCIYLRSETCNCTIYEARPSVCRGYSCKSDTRIWSDFENMIINPDLKQRLDALDVVTGHGSGGDSSSTPRASVGAHESSALTLSTPPSRLDAASESSSLADRANLERTSNEMVEIPAPNFDDLRALIVPRPTRRFSPPRHNSNDGTKN